MLRRTCATVLLLTTVIAGTSSAGDGFGSSYIQGAEAGARVREREAETARMEAETRLMEAQIKQLEADRQRAADKARTAKDDAAAQIATAFQTFTILHPDWQQHRASIVGYLDKVKPGAAGNLEFLEIIYTLAKARPLVDPHAETSSAAPPANTSAAPTTAAKP